MIKKIFLFIVLTFLVNSFGQTRMISFKQHTVVLHIPKRWIQIPNDKMSFYLIPFKKEANEKTFIYIYVHNLENKESDMNSWLNYNNDLLKEKNSNIKIDSILNNSFENIKKSKYITGRYKLLTYEFENQRKEAQLVIETKKTIIAVVLSAENKNEFKKQFRSFKRLIKSLSISNSPSVMYRN
jgi:hypothetical protein